MTNTFDFTNLPRACVTTKSRGVAGLAAPGTTVRSCF